MSSINDVIQDPHDDMPRRQPSPLGRLAFCGMIVCIAQIFVMFVIYSAFSVIDPKSDSSRPMGIMLANMTFAVLIVWAFSHKKAMSIGKASIFLFLLSTIFNSFSDLRGDNENVKAVEEFMKSLLVVFKEYAQTLENVKDDATAQAAMTRIQELYKRAKRATDESTKLRPVSKHDRETVLSQYHPQAIRAGERLRDAYDGIPKKIKERYDFDQHIDKLFQLLKELDKGE